MNRNAQASSKARRQSAVKAAKKSDGKNQGPKLSRSVRKENTQVVVKIAPALKASGGKRASGAGIRILTAPQLAELPWLLHGFSTRPGGVSSAYGDRTLNLGPTQEDTEENVERNRELFLRKLGAVGVKDRPWPLVTAKQIHSAVIYRVDRQPTGQLRGDGLITDTPGILIGIKVADCLPVLIADPERRAVGAFHAGWRGTVQRIVEKGVGEMRRHFGSNPAKLLAAIGPGIGGCCYEIGEDVEFEFESQFAYWRELFEDVFDSHSLHLRYPLLFLNQRAPGHGEPALTRHLDLVKANVRQLRDAGLAAENIWRLGLCTSCRSDQFFSYRRDRVTGRMMAVAGIRP